MCHISYRETIVGSIQRKPGTARGGGREGTSERRGVSEKERKRKHVNIKLFPLGSVGQEHLVVRSHTDTQ